MDRSNCGIIYFASGKDHIKGANVSAKSVRSKLTGIPIAIFTDGNGKEFLDENLFDKIITSTSGSGHKVERIESLVNSPFEKTLFLDTDTEMLEPVDELFKLLDNFDLAVAHAPKRLGKLQASIGLECFPECNTGVLLFKKNEKTSDFFFSWIKTYNEFRDEGITINDQPSFRKALYDSFVRFYILPPEYNLRTVFPYFAGTMPVKIIHGKGISMERAKRNINKSHKVRSGKLNNGFWINKIYELIYRYF